MSKRIAALIPAVMLLALAFAVPAHAGARYPYTLTDVGTLGGPQSFINLPGFPITRQGAVLGTADTKVADSDYPNFNPFIVGVADPYTAHAFTWQNGKLTDLGALPGNNSSAVFQINGSGVGAGMSETGALDPNTGYPAENAVLFKNGSVINLGTLPGGHESQATAINDRGQVAGFGDNGVRDPVSIFGPVNGPGDPGWVTQTRSFIWQNGKMRDLGTLGGPDTLMTVLNARGQIAGDSYTNATPNPANGGVPTTHPFLWQDGHMRDLGTLGGTRSGTTWLNDRGEVVGQDNLAGDQASHPFLWDGQHLRDLGTLGGDFGAANYVNDAGDVTGWTTVPGDSTAHAFLWKHGVMTDLTGAGSSQCTVTEAVNDRDQVVGHTCDEQDALLWTGGKQYELDSLVAPSGIHLTAADFINDRGQIVALGTLPNGHQHLFLLNPTDKALGAAASGASRQSGGHHVTNLISTPAKRFLPRG
jgi:probable HAF family extracellular repeat protein